jgi:NADH:ubiquinone oxidoreductase subunit 6 (subunit J)
MHLYRDQQHARVYRPLTAADGVVFVLLSSATILLVGVGESGLEAARLCKVALGVARVIVFTITLTVYKPHHGEKFVGTSQENASSLKLGTLGKSCIAQYTPAFGLSAVAL